MTPAQRGAQTRARNHEIRRALLTEARLPEVKQRVAETQELVVTLARLVATRRPGSVTTVGPSGTAVNELARAIGQLNYELHWLWHDEAYVKDTKAAHPHAIGNVVSFPRRTED